MTGSAEVLDKWWPILAVAAAGLIAWGVTTSTVAAHGKDIAKLEGDVEKLETKRAQDREEFIEVRTKLDEIDSRTKTMQSDIAEVLRRLPRPSSTSRPTP
jgi:chromosome segregation ATPase